MPEVDPTGFTQREQFVLSYYRARDLSGARGFLGFDALAIITSLGCIVYAESADDPAFWFVGYTLLLLRLAYILIEGRRWVSDFQSIFSKYDAKVAALEAALKSEKNDKTSV